MTGSHVERLTEKDRAAFRDLLLDITSVFQDEGVRASRPASADRLMRSATSPNSTVLVVKEGHRIVGFAETHARGKRTVHFHRAAVHHDSRKKGVFTALLEAVIQLAGNKKIEADIRPDRAHYRTMLRHGFRPIGPSPLEDGMERIVR